MSIIRRNATTILHIAAILIVGFLVYSNTLTSSFQFDDKINIVDNPFIRDIRNLWPPYGARWFGLLTFSLNYTFGGLNPVGYHLVNICIHVLTALSVYAFVLLTFRTAYFAGRQFTVIPGNWFALACALLFVSHPIQTQAVTYIVQRFASLASLLYMLSLDFYILARLQTEHTDNTACSSSFRTRLTRFFLYVAAVLSALLSLKTKEIAYTLPFMLLLYDTMFISGLKGLSNAVRKRWRVVVSLALTFLAALAFVITTYGLQATLASLKATNEISRLDYLITQFRVIVTYIRLLIIPVGQTVDHHFKVYHSILEPSVLASLAFLAVLAVAAICFGRASRQGNPYLRLIAFGIVWFFITLAIESSLIPIIDVMFEHRLYLPSIGAIIAVIAAIAYALEKIGLKDKMALRFASGILIIVTVALSCTTYVRNRVWENELTLWSDAIAKKPDNPRGYNMVGSYYLVRFRVFDAIGYFRKAIEVDSTYAEAHSNLGNAYLLVGKYDEGLNELLQTEKSNRLDPIDTGILFYNIGKAYYLKGMPDQALVKLNLALTLIPNEAAVYALLGEISSRKNLPELAAAYFRKAHELNPQKY